MPDTPQVDALSDAMAAISEPWAMIDALLGGTAAMRKAEKKFLPQWPGEEDDAYKARLGCATLFPAFSRTCGVMAAKPFSRAIAIDEATIPAPVNALLGDVDLQGTALAPFAADLMARCIEYGLVGVLVETPPRPQGVVTVADERKAGIRPYFATYPGGSILGWKCERKGKQSVLTQLRLAETYTTANGPWLEVTKPQVRVCEPGRWEIWRKSADGTWFKFEEGVTSIGVIPFVFFYGIREGFGVGQPPLEDLAYLNVEHWQSGSDQQTILHVARVPILFGKGFAEDDDIVIGASQATLTQNKDADLKYVEHSGKAIDSGKQSLETLEERMVRAGAELLVQRPSAAHTATQTRSEDEGNRSILQKIVEGFEESLADCLNLMGRFVGQPAMKARIQLYKDFGSATLKEAADLLLRAAAGDHVSSQTVFDHLKRIDAIAAEQTWDAEKKRMDEDVARDVAKQTALAANAQQQEKVNLTL